MFRKLRFEPSRLINTTIAENTSITGEIKCDGNMRVEGLVTGSIECTGNLIVGERATVKADIRAHNVSVQGAVEGNIDAERVEILSSGRVQGDVTVVDLLLDEGGVVRGHVIMRKDEVAAPQPLPLAVTSKEEPSSTPAEA